MADPYFQENVRDNTEGTTRPENTRDVSLRAVGLGLVVAAFVGFVPIFSEDVNRSGNVTLSHFPIVLFFAFLTIVLCNGVMRRLGTRALSAGELLTVLSLGFLSSTLPTNGVTGFLLGTISAPYYFATPENGWNEYLGPHIPGWIAPNNLGNAVGWFYEGIPSGVAIPWAVWAIPLAWWFCLILAAALVSFCIAVILRKQWVEHERLVYPMLGPAVLLTEGGSSRRGFPDFVRSRAFWAGFVPVFGLFGWNVVSYFSFLIPAIPTSWGAVSFGRTFITIPIRLNFFTSGFAYFANLDVLASVWVFFLVYVLEMGIFARYGFSVGPRGDDFECMENAAGSWQGMGAMIFIVGWGLWISRRHLKAIFRKAFPWSPNGGDEVISYHTALLGILFGTIFITAWLVRSGMELRVALLFLFGTFVIHVGIARIVAESGLIYVLRGPLTAQTFSVNILGTRAISPVGLTATAFSYALIAHGKGLFMPALVHVAKLADGIRERRRLVGGLALTLIVGLAVSVGITLYLGYTRGAYNFRLVGPFSSGPKKLFNSTVSRIRTPASVEWGQIGFLGVGMAVMGILGFLRYRFTRWPINPIGLPMAGTYGTRQAAFPVFLTWIAKAIILRLGGVGLYRQAIPFFVGLTVGQAAGVALSITVDMIWFPGNGHYVHGW